MKSGNKLTERQRRNLRFSEKYFDLLDAISELGDTLPDRSEGECRGQEDGRTECHAVIPSVIIARTLLPNRSPESRPLAAAGIV